MDGRLQDGRGGGLPHQEAEEEDPGEELWQNIVFKISLKQTNKILDFLQNLIKWFEVTKKDQKSNFC